MLATFHPDAAVTSAISWLTPASTASATVMIAMITAGSFSGRREVSSPGVSSASGTNCGDLATIVALLIVELLEPRGVG